MVLTNTEYVISSLVITQFHKESALMFVDTPVVVCEHERIDGICTSSSPQMGYKPTVLSDPTLIGYFMETLAAYRFA